MEEKSALTDTNTYLALARDARETKVGKYDYLI